MRCVRLFDRVPLIGWQSSQTVILLVFFFQTWFLRFLIIVFPIRDL